MVVPRAVVEEAVSRDGGIGADGKLLLFSHDLEGYLWTPGDIKCVYGALVTGENVVPSECVPGDFASEFEKTHTRTLWASNEGGISAWVQDRDNETGTVIGYDFEFDHFEYGMKRGFEPRNVTLMEQRNLGLEDIASELGLSDELQDVVESWGASVAENIARFVLANGRKAHAHAGMTYGFPTWIAEGESLDGRCIVAQVYDIKSLPAVIKAREKAEEADPDGEEFDTVTFAEYANELDSERPWLLEVTKCHPAGGKLDGHTNVAGYKVIHVGVKPRATEVQFLEGLAAKVAVRLSDAYGDIDEFAERVVVDATGVADEVLREAYAALTVPKPAEAGKG